MSFKVISRNVGYALLVSALFMLVGVIIAASGKGDTSLVPLAVSFLITFISGVFPMIFVRRTPSITLREGYVIIVLSWLLSFVFGMLPGSRAFRASPPPEQPSSTTSRPCRPACNSGAAPRISSVVWGSWSSCC